jgi:hypothetical protein
MAEEYTFLLNKYYYRESRAGFPEKRNGKIIGIPGNREREIPGMKHYWTRTRRQLRMTADFCPHYFIDCTALLGFITMEPVIRSGQFFLINGQGHIFSNSIFCLKLKMMFF